MNILQSIKNNMLTPIHSAGIPFIIAFFTLSALISFFLPWFVVPGLVLSLWCVYFFRNPERTTSPDAKNIIAPADGRILSIIKAAPPSELQLDGDDWSRIAIFMNVFDVHVNRAPVSGKILHKYHFPGKFFNAELDKASTDNERLGLVIATDHGQKIGCIQIAGLVARRILCDAQLGDMVTRGKEFGIIRFGSRVDVWLPSCVTITALPGQTSIAGETILAEWHDSALSAVPEVDA
ncbi:MAG: phosphatidylserine decarboxylase [Pseudomonadota bacterium]